MKAQSGSRGPLFNLCNKVITNYWWKTKINVFKITTWKFIPNLLREFAFPCNLLIVVLSNSFPRPFAVFNSSPKYDKKT